MTKKEINDMATYIMQCLQGNNVFVMWSWGPEYYQALPEGGLRFKVNGQLHQGWVQVVYDAGADYFKVRLENNGKANIVGEISKEITDVDCISLQSVVDHLVETKE